MRPTFFAITTAAFVGTALAAGPRPTASPAYAPTVVPLYNKSMQLLGTVTIAQNGPAIDFKVLVDSGISQQNGTHIHNLRTCAEVFATTGDDYNLSARKHGTPNTPDSHDGDLPMVKGGSSSDATEATVSSTRLALTALSNTTFVIHEAPDDFKPGDPHGNAGKPRICGAIP